MPPRVPKTSKPAATTKRRINKSNTSKPAATQRRFNRKNNGCWTCRRRKVKCDLRKPHCSRCEIASIPCEGFDVKLNWGEPLTVGNFIKVEADQDTNSVFQGKGISVRRSEIDRCEWGDKAYVWYHDMDLDLELLDLQMVNRGSGNMLRRGPFAKWRGVECEQEEKAEEKAEEEEKVKAQIRTNTDQVETASVKIIENPGRLHYILQSIPLINHFFFHQNKILPFQLITNHQKESLISRFFLSQGSDHISFNILLILTLVSQFSQGHNVPNAEKAYDSLLQYHNTIPQQLSSQDEEMFLSLLVVLAKYGPITLPETAYTHSSDSASYTAYTHLQLLYYISHPSKYTLQDSTHLPQSEKYLELYTDYLDPQYNLLTNIQPIITGTVYDEGRGQLNQNNNGPYENIEIKLSGKTGQGELGEAEYRPQFCIRFANSSTSVAEEDQEIKQDIYQYIKLSYHNTTQGEETIFHSLPGYLLSLFTELTHLILQSQYFQCKKYENLGYPRNYPRVCKDYLQTLIDCDPTLHRASKKAAENKDQLWWYKFWTFLKFWYYRCVERYPLIMLGWYLDEIKGLEEQFGFVRDIMKGVGCVFN
ncbi:hypothetical protein WICPIJ_001036 [Wickerhamomyces pijperi]|uniref:Zn(2)-C6 fungal-type domain-containing protein n=1 Tax=Wickerhamomyces pijperi TaxID=599730 RepID=A0A9P8QEP1_WICPI|nr:hypothetical protein WICPIJ_001036 [Wickerhamomyces pijperi]